MLLTLLRRRETRGPAAFSGRGARIYSAVPAHLQMPVAALARAEPAIVRSVMLGYSRCGHFLISYAYDEALRFELLLWRVALGPAVGGAWRAGSSAAAAPAATSPPRAALSLHASAPLFSPVDWAGEGALGAMLDGSAVRVRVWEPPDGGVLVALASLADGFGSDAKRRAHVTVVPSPFFGAAARSAPLALRAPGAGVLGVAPPSLNALHFSYDAGGAACAPGCLAALAPPAGGCAAAAEAVSARAGDARAYRLLLPRAGGSVLAVTFCVRPPGAGVACGEGGGDRAPPASAHCCAVCHGGGGGSGGGAAPPWLLRAAPRSAALGALLPGASVTLSAAGVAAAVARGYGDAAPLFLPQPPWGGAAAAAREDASHSGGWAALLGAVALDVPALAPGVVKGAVEDAAGLLLRPLGFGEACEHRAAFCGGGGGVGVPAGDEAAAAVGGFALVLLVVDHVLPGARAAGAPGPTPPGGEAGGAAPVRGVKRTFGGSMRAAPPLPPPLPTAASLLPWEAPAGAGGGAPPPPPPPPAVRYVVPEDAPPPVRSHAVLLWDIARGSVRVASLAKLPAALQPGLDAVACGRARTLADVARGVVARLRAGAAAGAWGGALPAFAATAELNNDTLLRGASLRQLVNPALPAAIVA
jgi:hypothetical protein